MDLAVSVPESLDLLDIADRVRGSVRDRWRSWGSPSFLSDNRRAISRRVVFWGLALQWAFALLVLRVPAGVRVSWSEAGEARRVGPGLRARGRRVRLRRRRWSIPGGPAGFVFAFRVLPTVIFVAALFAVLYHLGVMQWIVRGFAVVMAWLMGTSGAESLERRRLALPRPDRGPADDPARTCPRLTRSELLTVMTSGMAHVSGGVMAAYFAFGVEPRHILTAVIMTAPGAILLSKMLVPETEKPETLGTVARPTTRRPTPTCSTPRRAAPATACTWPSTSPRC